MRCETRRIVRSNCTVFSGKCKQMKHNIKIQILVKSSKRKREEKLNPKCMKTASGIKLRKIIHSMYKHIRLDIGTSVLCV